MSITGNLKTMQLAELLQWLSQSNKTGTLVIDSQKVTKKVYFRDGRVISSASTDEKEHLGHFLMSRGLIGETELSKAIEMQERTGMLLGKILVTIGAIDEKTLHKLLRLKAQESIYDIFTWPEGEFRFIENELPRNTMIAIDLDVTVIILEGVRRVDEWRRIREFIPTTRAIPVSVGELSEPSNPAAQKILDLIDDHRTVAEICLETHSSEFNTCKVLLDQVRKKRLKIVKPRWDGAEAGHNNNSAAIGAKALLDAAAVHLTAKRYEHSVRHLRAAGNLEPESREIKKAAEAGEARIREELEAQGIRVHSIPKLSTSLEDLTSSKITPQEGFMLTRIDGNYDIRSIIKISPLPQLDALLVFWRLHQAGHITLEEASS
ncbi:MAG: DUF4388 domain-containing protein [Acidobacteriota bacterium]